MSDLFGPFFLIHKLDMFRHVKFNGNPIDGVIEHIKNITNGDIFDYNYTKIEVPSNRTSTGSESGSVKVLFGIYNNDKHVYWSSKDNERNKFITIYLKYSVFLEGLGIQNNYVDWYKEYSIIYSDNIISWDYETTISTEEHYPFTGHQSFYFPINNPHPCKVIKIQPLKEYDNQKSNYAFYRIELFGRIIDPNPHQCTGTKSNLFYVLIIISTNK